MLYMAVTSDEYELPVAVEDSPSKLAKLLGTTGNAVRSSLCKGKTGRYNGYKYIAVEEIDEMEGEL